MQTMPISFRGQKIFDFHEKKKINGQASLFGTTDIIITEFQFCKTGKYMQKREGMSLHHKQLLCITPTTIF